MRFPIRRALALLGCSAAWLLAADGGAYAQRGGVDTCRLGLLALIVMIDAEEQDRSHYQSTAQTVVETCGPPAARQAAPAPPAGFDKGLCGKLSLGMIETIEEGKLDSPQFAEKRDEFAGKCVGR
jgi:hypothetical protein